MKADFDCIPCMIRQTIDTARLSVNDELQRRQIINKVLHFLQEADFQTSPPELGKNMYKIIRETTGNSDPFKSIKKRFNDFAMNMYDSLKHRVYLHADPVHLAVKLAISGNIIDFGAGDQSLQIQNLMKRMENQEFAINDFISFQEDLLRSRNILYLTDNAGEIVFDKLLIEVLRRFYPERNHKITVVVRGAPVINDATLEDARSIGLDKLVPVIDNGDDAPATLLHRVSEKMMKLYEQADLVISKGMGNFETLDEEKKRIYFLLKVKCSVVARSLKVPEGSLILKKQQA